MIDRRRPRSFWVDVNGARAHLLEAGRGRPVVVVLASPLIRAATYRPLLRALSSAARTFVVDLPGGGPSAPTRPPWAPERHARWTRDLLAALGLDGVTLVGHSNSGPVALLAAAVDDGRIASLVLADSIGTSPRPVWRVVLARALDSLLEPVLSLRGLPHVLANLGRHPATFAAQVGLAARHDVVPAAGGATVPAWVAWGRHDHTTPAAGGRRLARALPRGRFVLGPGSHDWPITRARTFARVVVAIATGDAARSVSAPPHDAPPRWALLGPRVAPRPRAVVLIAVAAGVAACFLALRRPTRA